MIRQELKMEERNVLREVTNTFQGSSLDKKCLEKASKSSLIAKPALQDLLLVSHTEMNFGECLPGSIHEQSFIITLRQNLESPSLISLCIVTSDSDLNNLPELVFGIRQSSQNDFYDDYKLKVSKAAKHEFVVGVKTPLYYFYEVKCQLFLYFDNYEPIVVDLKQTVQLPSITCPKELETEESRLIKLGVVKGKSKKECRVPFKLNHDMRISVTTEILSLEEEVIPIVDLKPKSMILNGKGQFSISFCTNITEKIKEHFQKSSKPYSIRRILIIKIKDTKFIYHFPVQVTFFPESKSSVAVD